jgi:hypothetical protein
MPAGRHAFFTSEFLAQLERLSLLSRRIFRGRVKGERRSLRRGHSVEFCDYRAYGWAPWLRRLNIYGRRPPARQAVRGRRGISACT